MSYALRFRLGDVSNLDTKLRTVPQGFDDPLLQGSEDNADLCDARCSKLVESVHQHRLVGDGQHVLVPGVRQGAKSRSMPASK